MYLTREQVRDLGRHGFEIASHGLTHARGRRLDARRIEQEVLGNRRALEAASGRPLRSFSVPYGSAEDLSPGLAEALHASGHASVFLVEGLPNPRRTRSDLLWRVCPTGRTPAELFLEIEVLPRLRRARRAFSRA